MRTKRTRAAHDHETKNQDEQHEGERYVTMADVFQNVATTPEAAIELGLSRRHVWWLWRKKQLQGEKRGHDLLIYRPSLEKLKKERGKQG